MARAENWVSYFVPAKLPIAPARQSQPERIASYGRRSKREP